MSKSKRNARNEVQNTVINQVNEEVMETVVENHIEEVVEKVVVMETLKEKIERLKAEQKARIEDLQRQERELKEQVKQMKAEEIAAREEAKKEEAKNRFALLASVLEWPEANKRDAVIKAILRGCNSAEEVVEMTGYTQKFVSDTIWGLEKANGIR